MSFLFFCGGNREGGGLVSKHDGGGGFLTPSSRWNACGLRRGNQKAGGNLGFERSCVAPKTIIHN